MVKLVSKNQNSVCRFVIDSVDEIDKLPKIDTYGKDSLSTVKCSVGSTVDIAETSERYILNGNKNEWIKFSSGSSSSGGSGEIPEGYTIATTVDIDSLF